MSDHHPTGPSRLQRLAACPGSLALIAGSVSLRACASHHPTKPKPEETTDDPE